MYSEKRCPRCGEVKLAEAFSKSHTHVSGLTSYCKPCHKQYRSENRERDRLKLQEKRYADPEKYREYDRRHSRTKTLKKYGLTDQQFAELAKLQNGQCKICDKIPKDRLVVDHNHDTGVIRGLLCRQCNAAIGLLGDNIEGVQRAWSYLLADNT